MVKARLERKNSRDPNDGWWLEINGTVPPESFHLASAVENHLILQRMLEINSAELVIDFSNLTEFDSRGLLLLLRLSNQFSPQHIQIILHNPSPYLSRVLRIMQFEQVFKLEMDENFKGEGK